MKIIAQVKDKGDSDEQGWLETWTHVDVTDKAEAEVHAYEIIRQFNNTLQKGEHPRALIGIDLAEDDLEPEDESTVYRCDTCGKEWEDTEYDYCPFCDNPLS